MSASILDSKSVRRCLSIRDLSDPDEGPHALGVLVNELARSLASELGCSVQLERQSPIVSVADNYDALGYPHDAVAREHRYSRYVCETALLRTHTTAMIPSVLRRLAQAPGDDWIVLCPGLVYRRETIDRLHTGEPHQMDVWRLRRSVLDETALRVLVDCVVRIALPGRTYRTTPARHPYTDGGLQIDVHAGDEWVEIGECGLAAKALLDAQGLPSESWSGLALGLGLDRLLMLRKGIPDIRLLRSREPRVARQMLDLSPYRPVSSQPSVRRDLSLVLDADDTLETLGDRVREALDADAEVVESVSTIAETDYDALPAPARERLGIAPGQRNALVRVVLAAYDRSLTHAECNRLRDRIYRALHRGSRWEWAVSPEEVETDPGAGSES